LNRTASAAAAGRFPQLAINQSRDNRETMMTEKLKSELVSRRGVFGLFGVAIASSLAIPASVLTATDAEARVGNPASAVSVAGANRRDRRDDRRNKKKKKK
jgi:hypothetical protein